MFPSVRATITTSARVRVRIRVRVGIRVNARVRVRAVGIARDMFRVTARVSKAHSSRQCYALELGLGLCVRVRVIC